MATLNKQQKRFIVERLACFEQPSAVAAAVHEVFGVEVSRQQVYNLDPSKAANDDRIADDLRDLFAEARERFKAEAEAIPVANRSYRLARLQKLLDDERLSRNPKHVRDVLRDARDEMKGIDVVGNFNLEDLSDDELERVARGEDPVRVLADAGKRRA